MSLVNQISLLLEEKALLARFWQSASQFWRTKKASVICLTLFLIVVTLLQLLTQILLNLWNRNFFDALARHDADMLWRQAQLFVLLAGVGAFLAATAVWGRMTTQRQWREALTRLVVQKRLSQEGVRAQKHFAQRSDK